MTDEIRQAGEDFSTPGLLRQNAPRWGYTKAGYLSDGVTHTTGTTTGFRLVYACDYCASLLVVRGAGPFGDKNSLVLHAMHCVAIPFGLRYVRAHKLPENEE